jgi:hypothetical protein
MAKAPKKVEPQKRIVKYEEEVAFDSTFENRTDKSVKDAEKKAADKKVGDTDTKSLEDKIDAMNAKKDKDNTNK